MLPEEVRRVVAPIEDILKIEVVIYAALGTKRCSDFIKNKKSGGATSGEMVNVALTTLGLKVQNLRISVRNWPSYEDFEKKFSIPGICRSDNVMGRFLDIPSCCADRFAIEGDRTDRDILRRYPYQGIDTPETIKVPSDTKEKLEWFQDFSAHMRLYRSHVFDYSQSTKVTVRNLMRRGTLPPEICFLLCSYIPCTALCKRYIAMAHRMRNNLKICLSAKRYQEIYEGYQKGSLSL